VNEIVWDMMPQIHQGTKLLLLASSVTVVVAMLALLGLVVAITAYVNDSPRALVPVALVTTALCGLVRRLCREAASLDTEEERRRLRCVSHQVLKLGREEPLAGATGCFVVLVLFSAWRLLACASYHVREAAASPRGAARLAAGCACVGLLGRLAYEYRGTTGSRWLLLIYLTLSASLGGVALLAPFCLSRSLAGFGAVSSAWKRQASPPPPLKLGSTLGPSLACDLGSSRRSSAVISAVISGGLRRHCAARPRTASEGRAL